MPKLKAVFRRRLVSAALLILLPIALFLWFRIELSWKPRRIVDGGRRDQMDPTPNFVLSSDGRLVAWTNRDSSITVRDLEKERTLGRIHRAGVLVPECFSKDGSILAVKAIQKGDKTGEVLWDVHNWRPRRTLVRDEFCNFVALTPDNRTLVEATADSLSFFDSRTGRLRATFKVTFPTQADFNEGGDYIAGLDFTPDSRLAITGGTRSPCHIWDVKTGRLLHRSDNNLADHVALSPDGNTALLSGLYGITLYLMLWNVKTGRVIHRQNDTQTHYSPTYAMFSPDGKLIIAVMNHTTIDIRDSSNLRLIRTIRAFTNSNVYDLPCVVFSHDGHYLLVQWNDTVRVITVEGATLREVTLPGENIRSLIPASDGATVYISTDRSLWRWRFL